MLFNSFEFLVFFPLVTILFYVLPHPIRWFLLLLASCVFYCYLIPAYLLILLFIIIIDYLSAIQIEKSKVNKKAWLLLSIFANLGILCVFKYYNFFAVNFDAFTELNLTLLNWALPIGLSFHTFQALSYTIEVYKGNCKAERHAGLYALYVLFYPQLVAGPIERPQNIFPQFKKRINFNVDNITDGLRLMTWGFFKKLVIADRVSLYVNIIYNHPNEYNAINVLIAIFFFSIQIYCDFSGYTDIARGAAKCLGYNLMINFNRPFFAGNIREFWHRWHISLSTWFRDYVYIPLGGNKKSILHRIFIVILVFLLSGFWHGAGWNFIIWGLLHAFFMIVSLLFFKKKNYKSNIAGIIATNILVAYAFVFFRSDSILQALNIITSSINFNTHIPFQLGLTSHYGETGLGKSSFIASLLFITFMFIYERFADPSLQRMNRYPAIDIAWFIFIVLSIIVFGMFTNETFIYFQF